jgi:ABC-type branched-subunit amino acid transport system substrate-binding protein
VIRQQMQHVAGLEQLPLIGADGMMTPGFVSTIGLAGGPVYATVAVVDTMSSASADTFNRQYDAVYGSANRNIYSALAYDCANILIQAIKMAMASGAHPHSIPRMRLLHRPSARLSSPPSRAFPFMA